MYCTSCGNRVNETDKFCSNCGAQIIQPFTDTNPELTAILTDAQADIDAAPVDETVNDVNIPEIPAPVITEEKPAKEAKKVSKAAVAGLIFGILGLALAATCCGCIFAFLPAILGIIFSSIGIAKSNNRTLGIIAFVLSISAIILAVVDIAMFTSSDFAPLKSSFKEIEDSFDFYDFF